MNATTIPVTITEEAARRLAPLAAQSHLETLIEWKRGHVPRLRAIVVRPGNSHFSCHANQVFIDTHCTRDHENPRSVPIEWDWANWKVEAIPLDVCRHFIMSCNTQPVPAP